MVVCDSGEQAKVMNKIFIDKYSSVKQLDKSSETYNQKILKKMKLDLEL